MRGAGGSRQGCVPRARVKLMCCFGSTRGSPTAVWREDARGADARRASADAVMSMSMMAAISRCAGRALRCARTSRPALRYARASAAAAASGVRVRRRRIFRRIFRRRTSFARFSSSTACPTIRSVIYQMRAALEALADGDDRLLVDGGARLRIAAACALDVSAFAVAAAQALAADVPLNEVALLSHWAPAASEIADGDGPHRRGARRLSDAPPDAAAYVIVGPANGRPHRAAVEAQARAPCVLVNRPTPGGLAGSAAAPTRRARAPSAASRRPRAGAAVARRALARPTTTSARAPSSGRAASSRRRCSSAATAAVVAPRRRLGRRLRGDGDV